VAVDRRTAHPRFVLLVLALSAVTLVTLDARSGGGGLAGLRSGGQDALAPLQQATQAVSRTLGDFLAGVVHYGDLTRENARLRDQLAAAKGQQDLAAEARRELRLLLGQQGLGFVGGIPTVAAQIVDTSSSNFEVSVQVNRGSDSGVAVGMPVVAGGGLVGRVVEVAANRSTVLLLTDPTFSVGVRLTSSGDVAVAGGRGRQSPMRLDLVEPSTAIKAGDVVVTSGLQLERFPKDIPVGKVRHVEMPAGALEQDVTLDPAVDLSRLEFVQILHWSPQS
jgi:rod shape-determining protein MreC